MVRAIHLIEGDAPRQAETLADAATLRLSAIAQAVLVLKYDDNSEYCPAIYTPVDTEPDHDLKFQNGGDWWAINEPLIDARMAGAVPCTVARSGSTGELVATGTAQTTALLRAYVAAENARMLIQHPYISGEMQITTDNRVIEFVPGFYDNTNAVWVNGGLFPTTGMAALAMFDIRASNVKILYMTGVADPCVSTSSTATLADWIEIPRQSSSMPGQNWHRRDITIVEPNLYGGKNGMNVRSTDGFKLVGGKFDWQFDQGIVVSGDPKNTELLDFEINYTGCPGNAGSGGFRIGTTNGSSCRDLHVRGKTKWTGWLADTVSGKVSTTPQSGFDIFMQAAENIRMEITTHNCGDCIEVKKTSDTTTHNNYRNVDITVNSVSNMCSGITHVKLRDDSGGTPSPTDKEKTQGMTCRGVITSDPFSQKLVLGTNKISTTAGSRTVTVETPSTHWGETGDMIKIFGCGPIGGVSATQFCRENFIERVDSTHFTFELDYPAQSTATGGTDAEVYGLFRTPQSVTFDVTNGSSVMTINMTAHGLSAGDTVDISSAATTGGIDDTFLNRTYRVRTVPGANSFTVWMPASATSTVSGTSCKVRVRRNSSETGVWAVTWGLQAVRDFTFNELFRVALFEGCTGATEEPQSKAKIDGWVLNNCGDGIEFGTGYTDDLQIGSIVGDNYGIMFSTNANCKAVRRLRTAGQMNIVTREGQASAAFIQGAGYQHCVFGRDTHVIDNGPYYRGIAKAGSREDSYNCTFSPISTIVNPDDPTAQPTVHSNFELDGSETNFVIANGFLTPTNTARATITNAGTPGIGAAGVAYNNVRSYTTDGALTAITWAGAEGEFVPASAQTDDYRGQQCVTAGASGAAVWKPIGTKTGSATYDPANLVDGAGATTTVTVTGAALGDYADASFSLDLQGIQLTAWVSAADTVSVRFQNETGGAIDLGSGTLRVRVRDA